MTKDLAGKIGHDPSPYALVPPSMVKLAPGDVTRFRSGNECDERGDLFHVAVTLQGRVGDLGRRPITGWWVEIGVDGARLEVVDGDAAPGRLQIVQQTEAGYTE